MELLDELGIQLEGVERDWIRHTGEIGKAQQQEHVATVPVFLVNLGPVRGEEEFFVDVTCCAEPAADRRPEPGAGRITRAYHAPIVLH